LVVFLHRKVHRGLYTKIKTKKKGTGEGGATLVEAKGEKKKTSGKFLYTASKEEK